MNRRPVVLMLAAIAILTGCGAGDPNEPAPSTPISTRTIAPSTLSPATTLVSGLPRQVGTDGNFQVFEVTAHSVSWSPGTRPRSSPARGSGIRGSASALPTRSRSSTWC